MITDYETALAYIHGRPRIKKETTQRRINELLQQLGHPERQIKTVHIVGTNGKGSVVAYLQQLLMESGLLVGAFTSPFIVRFNERIQINQVSIPDQKLVQLVQRVQPVVTELDAKDPELGPSEFELITALMYLYFHEQGVQIALVEAGIGGQSDSTNVADQALMTIITTIGMDHMAILGDTLTKIATDKAGMIREDCPTVTGPLPDEANQIVQEVAINRHSQLVQLHQQFDYHRLTAQSFSFQDQFGNIRQIKTNMIGDFEMEDAAVAIAAFRNLTQKTAMMPVTQTGNIIQSAIPKTRWAGRMEVVQTNPRTLIDGAHNVPAVRRLLETLDQFPEQRFNVVLAVLADKQYQKMVKLLRSDPRIHLYLTEFSGTGQRGSADFSDPAFADLDYITDWKTAITVAQHQTSQKDLTLITGSLLFIATVRAWFFKTTKN
ncbi:bifunctional folylpolyglutamate synthase/dihydrofolate synthase [Fructilactobacillus cliffordii]|uniref:bifunctional folylpolyglutamate synthase/dihydrofolate synthase n=1 Tax=Fructilactobacillus cliffordii TaxID=2940299 RepID=UPI002092CBFD|nr:folylpolyglutamate synthase/dihydrofolate synthase family protein [Fructilactobacillus cliffordii]USS86824.1 bifunctional folylpolyglutamate synthase/dihydrofolate synthase [Fructilactobacillus cliffordii]